MKNSKQITALFIVIVIDGLSTGMMIPVLATQLASGNHGIFSGYSLMASHLLYGVILSLSPIAFFFGAPLIGHLSDIIGRKKSLVICMVITSFGYILYSIAFSLQNILLLIIGRFFCGFAKGNQSIAWPYPAGS